MSTTYRLDDRSLDEFKQDIFVGHQRELEIAIRICIDKFNKIHKWPELIPTGTNFTGSFEKDKNVNTEPDFYIEPHMVEITHSGPPCKRYFHQKINKVKKCISDKNYMVFVNGLETQTPKYIYLSPYSLKAFTELAIITYGDVVHPGKKNNWTNKPAYRYNIEWFEKLWKPLPDISSKIPKSYSKLLMVFNGK